MTAQQETEQEQLSEAEQQKQKLEQKRKKIIDKLVKESFDQTKFEKMDYAEGQQYANHLEDLNVVYNTKTKAMIVVELAYKLKKQDYPIYEIKEKITEGYEGRINSIYISRCLPDEFKNPARIEAGKRNVEKRHKEKEKQTLEALPIAEEQQQIRNEHEHEHEHELEIVNVGQNTTPKELRESLPDIKPALAYSDEYVQSLLNTIAKLKGEVPYKDIKCVYRVNKLAKTKCLELEAASRKSKGEVYLITDTRTQEIISIVADTDKKKLASLDPENQSQSQQQPASKSAATTTTTKQPKPTNKPKTKKTTTTPTKDRK